MERKVTEAATFPKAPGRPAVVPAGKQVVSLRLALSKAALQSQVKRAGGLWEPQRRGWALRSDRVVA